MLFITLPTPVTKNIIFLDIHTLFSIFNLKYEFYPTGFMQARAKRNDEKINKWRAYKDCMNNCLCLPKWREKELFIWAKRVLEKCLERFFMRYAKMHTKNQSKKHIKEKNPFWAVRHVRRCVASAPRPSS